MGGKAAKERRRLARLAAANEKAGQIAKTASASNKTDTTTNKSPRESNSRDGWNRVEQNRFPSQSRLPSRGSHAAGAVRHNGTNPKFRLRNRRSEHDRHGPRATTQSKLTKTEKKKKKVKKPKHLKRKIEKVSAEGDEEARQRLVEEMKQFDARKAAMAKPATKRPKPNSLPVSNSSSPSKPGPHASVVSERVEESKVSQPKAQMIAADPLCEKEVAITEATSTTMTMSVDTGDTKSHETTTDDSDSDSDMSLEDAPKRQRGRRRRGRKSTEEHAKTIGNDLAPPTEPGTIVKRSPTKIQIPTDSPSNEVEKKNKSDPSKKTSRKDDKRRCIGRKPVTEFVVGQRYPGKIVYTKPFGAFIDVGCHSDAFCHVSRVQDDYVESIDDALSIGQEVNARIVEVDRKAKRLTVSLQSDARVQDERASVEARKERKEKLGKRKRPASQEEGDVANVTESVELSSTPVVPPKQPITAAAPIAPPPPPKDEAMMTPAELKRARKLARRAARREQQAQTGLSV